MKLMASGHTCLQYPNAEIITNIKDVTRVIRKGQSYRLAITSPRTQLPLSIPVTIKNKINTTSPLIHPAFLNYDVNDTKT